LKAKNVWLRWGTGIVIAAMLAGGTATLSMAEEVPVEEITEVASVDGMTDGEVFAEESPAENEMLTADPTEAEISAEDVPEIVELIEDEAASVDAAVSEGEDLFEIEDVSEETVDEGLSEDLITEEETFTEEAQDLAYGSGSAQYASASEIVVGGTYNVALTETLPNQYFKFVPTATAVYSFISASTSSDENYVDPYARIFDSSGTMIGDDDDNDREYEGGNSGLDFNLRIKLNAGTVYYFQAATYSEKASYSFTVSTVNVENMDEYANLSRGLQVWRESNRDITVCPNSSVQLVVGWSNDENKAPTFKWSYYDSKTDSYVDLPASGNTATVTAPSLDSGSLAVRCVIPELSYYDEEEEEYDEYSLKFNIYSSADAHEPGDWVQTVAPTALNEGTQVRICKLCGQVAESASIPRLPAFINMNVAANSTIPLKVRQATTKIKVTGLQTGDYVRSWTSSKPKIATVNANGKITGKKKGTTVITVTTASGLSYSFKIKVQKSKVATKKIVTESPKKLTLKKKAKAKIGAQLVPITTLDKISYATSDKKVAGVSKGIIVAKNKGNATITVKAGKKKIKIKVKVIK